MTQTIKKYWTYALFAFALVFFTIRMLPFNDHDDDDIRITSALIRNGSGWGYEIFANDSLYIRQDHIPAIPGRKPFATAAEARATVNLVIKKMKTQGGLPFISMQEIDSLHITH